MKELFGKVVFTVGNEEYYWEDVVLAAKLRGEWDSVDGIARELLACLERADETGDSPSSEEVQQASVEFRYENDLISGQETQAWLDRWGLSAESWMEYFEGALLRGRWADELERIVESRGDSEESDEDADSGEDADEDLARLVHAEGVCSGSLLRFAQKLAGRAALHARMAQGGSGAGDSAADAELSADLDGGALPGLSPERLRERLAVVARVEDSFRRFRDQALTPKAMRDQLSSHHLDWMRFDCRSVSFPDEQMAREAVLCLQEDCRDLADVAAMSKRALEETSFYLDQLEPSLRDRFLAARKGELLGPLGVEDRFTLFLVDEKRMPSEQDPEIRERAEEAVLEGVIAREVANRVEWKWEMPGPAGVLEEEL